MGPNLGTAYVKVAPNMTGIQGKIAAGFKGSAGPATAALGDEVEKNSGPFQSALGKLGGFAKAGGVAIAAGMAAGAAGLVAITSKALMAGAELEQNLGGSEAVFGQYAKDLQNSALTAYKTMGLSQNEFLAGANKMGSLFQGAGFDVQSSMKMSTESMQRASDVASIMGIDTTTALEAVQGMAKGNFTMMDNLGVAMNDTAIGAYAVSKGITKSTAAMSTQEKVGLAQQMFMEKTAKYAGNYAKENESLSGSINTTKKAFDDFMSGGNTIDGFIDSLLNTIKIAVPQLIAILPSIVDGIAQVIGALVPALSAALPVLLPALINAVVTLVNSLVAAMPQIIQALLKALPLLISGFIQLFLAIVQALPAIVTMIANALPEVITAIVNGITNPQALTSLIMGAIQLFLAIIQALPIIIVALVNALPIIIDNIIKTLTSTQFINMMIQASIQLFMAIIKAIPQIIGSLIGAMGSILKTIGDTLSPSNMGRIGGDMIKGLWNGISDLAGWVLDKIKGFGKSVMDGIKGIFGIHSPSTEWAWVGEMNMAGLAGGILDNAKMVTSAVDTIARDAMSGLALTPNMNLAASTTPYAGSQSSAVDGGVAAGAGIVQNNNIYNQVDLDSVSRELAWQVRR